MEITVNKERVKEIIREAIEPYLPFNPDKYIPSKWDSMRKVHEETKKEAENYLYTKFLCYYLSYEGVEEEEDDFEETWVEDLQEEIRDDLYNCGGSPLDRFEDFKNLVPLMSEVQIEGFLEMFSDALFNNLSN